MADLARIIAAHPFTVAYFSMEVGIDPRMPTYSGGLGVLAGDTLRAAADLGVPMVGITLLHRKGYFQQHLDALGNQTESSSVWSPKEFMEPMPFQVSVTTLLQPQPGLVGGNFKGTISYENIRSQKRN